MVAMVVVDGYTMNPGDLSWAPLQALGDCEIYDRTPVDQIVPRCQHAEIVIANKVVFDQATIKALPELKYIGITATGVDNVDLDAAQAAGITVTNVPGYSTESVVQHTWALLLELTNRVGLHHDLVQQSEWTRAEDFSYLGHQLMELQGQTLGIVGYGAIGKRVAEIAQALGMRINVYTRTARENTQSIQFVDWTTLLKTSDIVSLHCPLTSETRHMMDETAFQLMKPTALLVNTARGGLIQEATLANALKTQQIAGAAVDVLTHEPPRADCPLLNLENCIITPHIAWASYQARVRLLDEVVSNVEAFLSGNPRNVVI